MRSSGGSLPSPSPLMTVVLTLIVVPLLVLHRLRERCGR
jgi:hypothetical protein